MNAGARRACGAALLALLVALPVVTEAGRLIVKFRDAPASETRRAPSALARAQSLSQTTGVPLKHRRTLATGAELFDVPEDLDTNVAAELPARIAERADVEYAEPDRMRRVRAVDDTRFAEQWYLMDSTTGTRVEKAWETATGSAATVIAVVDTGVVDHEDLDPARVRKDWGYDFILDAFTANDGDGRDPDPSDPGDWVEASDLIKPECTGLEVEDSSWHGTHVIGMLAASANNGKGIAGIDRQARIVPVRALGKCGGWLTDIVDAIVWAAGQTVNGVPNPHPARIINASLGGDTACTQSEQDAINIALGRGAVVVVPAGNDAVDLDADPKGPADCDGVITVAATDSTGNRPSYSNFGSFVAIAAPGGSANPFVGILSTLNSGTQQPNGADTYVSYVGTSFAAANVSGVIALMLSVQPNLLPAQIKQILRDTGRPIANCDPSDCGGGLVDAEAAVATAQGTMPAPPPSDGGGGGALSGWVAFLWWVRRR